MYPITGAVMALFEAEYQKVLRITGTDKNGISISITDDNVLADSFQIDRYSCNGEKLEVGTAIAAQMSFSLGNIDGDYDDIVFEGTELFAEVGVADWTQDNPTVHWVPCGYFTPDEQPRRLSTISITALDRMTKFDVVVDVATLSFPTTVAGLVGQVCTACGVTLAQSISSLPNAGVTVAELPSAQEDITYRNLIQWCAGVMGTNAWFDWNGLLRFSWYDGVTGYVSTMDNRYNSDLYEDDLTISGVEYTNDSGIVIVEGTDDYAIDLTGNAIVGPLVATVLPPLNTALNGFTYRPFTAATVNAPYLWPMDLITFRDKTGNDHVGALTNVAFGLNGSTALASVGMTYAVNKAAQPKGFTREQAQLISQVAQKIEDDIDDSLTQQEIFNRLTDNGAAQGLVLYNGQLYVNASYINAGFLSAARIKGDTLTLGGENNVNGTMQVLDAGGNVVVTINNDGADITNGSVAAYSDDRQQRVILADGILTYQYYQADMQPLGWRDAFKLAVDDSFNSKISTYGGGGNLEILGRGRVSLSNKEGTLDEDTAEIDMDEDSITLFVRRGMGVFETATVQLTPDSFRMSYRDPTFGVEADVFEFVPEGASDTPLSIGNGGTGATTPAAARTSLGITPANIGAVAKTGDTMTGPLTLPHWININDDSQNRYGGVTFQDVVGNTDVCSILAYTAVHKLVFREKNSSNSTYEEYSLPLPTATGTIPIGYDILTTKTPVLVTQGGTGATTPAQARANLEITPANIGAPTTTGSGASGTWNINIPFSGDATGFKNFSLNAIDIDNTRGNWEAGFSDRDYHGTFPAWGGWCHVRQFDCDHFSYQVANSVTADGSKVYSLSVRSRWWNGSWGPWTDIFYNNGAVPVASGGTGATTPAQARANLEITPANIGAMPVSPESIELIPSTSATHGGFIDFHYAGSTSDYTSRIIEAPSGILNILGTLMLSNPLTVGNGGTGATTEAAARANLKTPYAANGTTLDSFSAIPVEDGLYSVYYSGTDTNAPVKTSAAWRWNVIQFGGSARLTQIAFCPTRQQDCMYMRQQENSTWYGWYKFQGAAI